MTSRAALLRRRADLFRELGALDEQLAALESDGASSEVSSVRLPADAKNVDAFNRACRSGRVHGAQKRGRIWVCELEAWNARERAPSPLQKRAEFVAVSPDLLAELGATRKAG